jgi:hypothetical protein
MSTEKDYWMELFEEFGPLTEPMSNGMTQMPMDVPKWVSKVQFQMVNLLAPKLQVRAGMKMNPARLGVFVGFNLFHCTQVVAMLGIPKPPDGPRLEAFMAGANLAGGAEILSREDNAKRLQELERGVRRIVARVLDERPLAEAIPFFKGFTRGIQGSGIGLVPRIVEGQPQFTPRQVRTMSTVIIYSVITRDWEVIDSLETSMEAYKYLFDRIPGEFLGNDPERIRALFNRAGKKFKEPGRPRGR